MDVANDPENRRRTVYGLVDRQDLPEVFRVFDFASPDQCNGKRSFTTVAQQALFAMNSPFIQQQTAGVMERMRRDWKLEELGRDEEGGKRSPSRDTLIRSAYRMVLLREPELQEFQRVEVFLGEAEGMWNSSDDVPSRMEQFVQALLMSNEFMFID